MMRTLSVLALLGTVLLVVACRREADVGGSGETEPTAEATTAVAEPEREPIDLVRSSLRAVATAQEAYWEAHQTYTTDLEVLKEIPGCEVKENVTVRIVEASENGWAMEATHPEFPERSCVQWYGRPGEVAPVATAGEGKRGDESPGRVVCDTP
jgi:hypothetical protein